MLELSCRGGSNEYPQSLFEQKYEKYQNFLSENFHFLVIEFSVSLARHVFVMIGISCKEMPMPILWEK